MSDGVDTRNSMNGMPDGPSSEAELQPQPVLDASMMDSLLQFDEDTRAVAAAAPSSKHAAPAHMAQHAAPASHAETPAPAAAPGPATHAAPTSPEPAADPVAREAPAAPSISAATAPSDSHSPDAPAAPEDTADLIAAAQAAQAASHFEAPSEPIDSGAGVDAGASVPVESGIPTGPVNAAVPDAPGDPIDPGDTADLSEAAAALEMQQPTDLGSTQGFAPLTDKQLINTDSTYDTGTSTELMWGARSDVGRVRSHNEDSYLVQPPLFAVCDGMGGHAAGEVASSIAVETIAKTAPAAPDPAALAAAVEAANHAIIEAAANGVGKPGMGCTATVAYIEGSTLAIAHVGDSRAYLLHEGSLIRVTHDHSYVEELVDAGEITADEARVHPNRSVITRALGNDPAMYADHFQLAIEEGDRLILCSDGLSSMIPDGEIERIATQSETAQICTDNLVDAALAAGGSDNVTVLVIDLVDDGKLKKLAHGRRRNLIFMVAALAAVLLVGALVTFLTVRNGVYLGTNNGNVAIYTGVRHDFMGLQMHWLEEDTSVKLSDLPDDTRHRLEDGIPQDSLDAARGTVTQYKKQIDEDQSKQAQDANAVRQGSEADQQSQQQGQQASGQAAQASGQTAAPASDQAAASQNPATTTDNAQGGDAQ